MTHVPSIIALVLGMVLAMRDRSYLRVAAGLVALVWIDVARSVVRLVRGDVSERLAEQLAGRTVPPYTGLDRWSWSAEQALFVAWYVVLAATVWMALRGASARLRWWLALPVAALATVVAYLAYPVVRGRPVELAYVALFLAALTVQLAAVTRYVLRWRRPDAARAVALVLAIGSVADLVMWMRGHPTRDWSAAAPTGVLIWSAIGGIEAWGIATAPKSL